VRRFNPQDCDVKNFDKLRMRSYDNVRLTGNQINKIYVDDKQSLEGAGLNYPKVSLIYEITE
jgi:hypothetical protein